MVLIKKWAKSGAMLLLVAMFLVACSSQNGGVTNTPAPTSAAGNDSGNEAGTQEPAEKVTIKVAIWDRGNAPSGQSQNDTFLVNWMNEELDQIGVEVEFVPFPRAQEMEKLNTWLASGTAPDLIMTYDFNLMNKFAEQGGLHSLDEYLDQHGPMIKQEHAEVLAMAGTYKGVRYGIPGKRSVTAGATMKIRQDWLDKLSLDAPTTTEELYEVLKAFKEQDPGNVGSNNVVPWALPALSSGMKGFFFGPAFGFGIGYDGPGGLMLMPTGNVENGVFSSPIVTEQGKQFFGWMNKLYHEGLISREFITDINSEKFTQHIATGVTGFVDSNDTAFSLTQTTQKSVPDAVWVELEPLVDPSGKQTIFARSPVTMVMMVPKTSKHPDAVVKYLNWMADPANMNVLKNGFEGEHYKLENGLVHVIDEDKYMNDIRWITNDLAVMGTSEALTPEQYNELYSDTPARAHSEIVKIEFADKFGQFEPVIDVPRPFAEQNSGTLGKYLYDNVSKAIIVEDFESAYESLLDGWNKLGGAEYDQEVTDALKAMGH